jgi:hypothetical protein
MMTSKAHRHYTKKKEVVDGKLTEWRVCRHCPTDKPTRYSVNSSTSTLQKHIDARHGDAPPPPARSSSSLSPSSSSFSLLSDSPPAKRRCTVQSTLDNEVMKVDNSALLPVLAKLFARCSLAHQMVEFDEFVDAAQAIRFSTCPLPDRRQLRAALLAEAQCLRGRVIRQLRIFCRSSPISIAIDGWTNVNTAKVTNVVLICGGEAYYWCSIVNGSHHNRAVWLRDPLVEVLNEIKAQGLVFTALVADNERVNTTLWELLLAPFPFLIRSACAAHLVQLCVLKALELPVIDPILTTMEAVIRQFRYKVHRLKLKQVQLAAAGSSLCLIRPCDTRWSSQMYAAERLVKLKTFIDLVLPQTSLFWCELEQVINFLKPFQLATDVMQKDTSCLYDIYQQFKSLLRHVKSTPSTSIFRAAKDDVTNIIIDMWEKHINIKAIISCATLSFDTQLDPALEARTSEAEEWFWDFAAKYSMAWNLSLSTDYDELRRLAKSQWGEFEARAATSSFRRLDKDIADERVLASSQDRSFNPRLVWYLHLRHAPVLAHAAVALLSVAGSEASVERTFSAQGDVHSDRRNRLADITVEAEMFIKFNDRTVKRMEEWERDMKETKSKKRRKRPQTAAPSRGREMDEDDEEEEGIPSIAGLFKRPERKEAAAEVQDEKEEKQSLHSQPHAVASAAVVSVPAPPPADEVQRFIESYVRKYSIHSKYRWRDYHIQQLESAGAEWEPQPMMDTVDVLKRKIMAWVRGQTEKEAEVADADVVDAE